MGAAGACRQYRGRRIRWLGRCKGVLKHGERLAGEVGRNEWADGLGWTVRALPCICGRRITIAVVAKVPYHTCCYEASRVGIWHCFRPAYE